MALKKRAKNKAIVALLSLTMIGTSAGMAFASNFKDIDGHWAQSQINSLVDRGIIKGYADNTFKPDSNITRAEFVSLINKAYNYSAVYDVNYSDASANDWFYEDLRKAKAQGYITGYNDNTIKPNAPITREEVAVIMSRVLNSSSDNSSAVDAFTDANKVSSWSKSSVGNLVALNYLNGYPDGSFGPQKNITRGEVSAMFMKIFDNADSANDFVISDRQSQDEYKSKREKEEDSAKEKEKVDSLKEFKRAMKNEKVNQITLKEDIDLDGDTISMDGVKDIDLDGNTIKNGTIEIDAKGEGRVELENGNIDADVIIDSKDIYVSNDTDINGKLIIEDIAKDGFKNKGNLKNVVINSSSKVNFENNGKVEEMRIESKGDVQIKGDIKELVVTENTDIEIKDKVEKLVIKKGAENVDITIDKNSQLEEVINNTDKTITINKKEYEPEKEKLDKEKAEKAKAEKEKLDKEKAEKAKAEKEKLDKEKAEKAKAEKEKLDKEKAEKAEKAEKVSEVK